MQTIRDETEFDRAREKPVAIIFKHSTMCGISARAHEEVEKYLSSNPTDTLYKVEVHEARPVSNYIEAQTGIRHESPQLLVFRGGELVWHGSHSAVTAEAIGDALR